MRDDPTHESLNAFLDGELAPREMERIASLLAARPDLEQWVRRQERLRAEMRGAFAEMTREPPPERLIRAVNETPVSWRWRMREAWRDTGVRVLAPAGAALALGLLIGIAVEPRGDIVLKGGQMMAQGALASALDQRLASEGAAGAGPSIGISFRDRSGRACRTFAADAQSGLACHGDKGWAIALLTAQPKMESQGAYRMAGSEMPDAVRAAVASSIAGEPFDAAAEKAARDGGWR